MKKISTLFVRDFSSQGNPITRQIHDGCEWVIENKGVPTRKFDGTATMIKAGKYYKRLDRKRGLDGKFKGEPTGWIECELDEVTGHLFGWALVDFTNPSDKWHIEGMLNTSPEIRHDAALSMRELYEMKIAATPEGTYELCGPKINANPEHYPQHTLVPHGKEILDFSFRNTGEPFDEIREWFKGQDIEGIVWYFGEKRAKLKKIDFNMKRLD
jgi:hypothetical protein